MRFLLGLTLYALASLSFAASSLTVSSSAAPANGKLPSLYTCDGQSVSPQIAWSGADPKALSFAIILSDPDTAHGTFYHWVLYNLPKNSSIISEGAPSLPAGTVVGQNSKGKNGYTPPCPPKGSDHHYIFNIYALDMPLSLVSGADASTLLKAMKNHVLQEGNYTMTFGH